VSRATGRIITTGGISAGVDGAFHVVARLLGEMTARRTAQYMEYDWTPDRSYSA
jgi:transcriptional regulator GlxA family with amidase domain